MTVTTAGFWPQMNFSMEADGQWVDSITPVSDPAWRFVDTAGHGHFYGSKSDPYPTLEWVSLPCSMGHDDCDSEGHYRCRTCLATITPGTKMPGRVWVAGMTTCRLTVSDDDGTTTVYMFGPEKWEQTKQAARAAIDGVLAPYVTSVERSR